MSVAAFAPATFKRAASVKPRMIRTMFRPPAAPCRRAAPRDYGRNPRRLKTKTDLGSEPRSGGEAAQHATRSPALAEHSARVRRAHAVDPDAVQTDGRRVEPCGAGGQ